MVNGDVQTRNTDHQAAIAPLRHVVRDADTVAQLQEQALKLGVECHLLALPLPALPCKLRVLCGVCGICHTRQRVLIRPERRCRVAGIGLLEVFRVQVLDFNPVRNTFLIERITYRERVRDDIGVGEQHRTG